MCVFTLKSALLRSKYLLYLGQDVFKGNVELHIIPSPYALSVWLMIVDLEKNSIYTSPKCKLGHLSKR